VPCLLVLFLQIVVLFPVGVDQLLELITASLSAKCESLRTTIVSQYTFTYGDTLSILPLPGPCQCVQLLMNLPCLSIITYMGVCVCGVLLSNYHLTSDMRMRLLVIDLSREMLNIVWMH